MLVGQGYDTIQYQSFKVEYYISFFFEKNHVLATLFTSSSHTHTHKHVAAFYALLSPLGKPAKPLEIPTKRCTDIWWITQNFGFDGMDFVKVLPPTNPNPFKLWNRRVHLYFADRRCCDKNTKKKKYKKKINVTPFPI